MKKFKYIAVNLEQHQYRGVVAAESEDELRNSLISQGLYLVRFRELRQRTRQSPVYIGGVPNSEILSFCRGLSILISSGVSVVDALRDMTREARSRYFSSVLETLCRDVERGLLLSEAMAKHPRVFPEYFRSMVHIGELGGSLDSVMVGVADYYENDAKVKSKIRSALAYPLMLIGMTLAVVVLLVTLVIPSFSESLASLDVEMPKITLAMFGISSFVLEWWWALVAGIFLAVLSGVALGKTEHGRYLYDTLKVKLPAVRGAVTALATSRFVRGFSLLVCSGMDTVDALDVISRLMGNKHIERRLALAIRDIRRGISISVAFESYKLFPQMLLRMIKVGESTGEMSTALAGTKEYFDSEVSSAVQAATSLLQPVILIILGVVIGVTFFAVYAPITSVMQAL